MEENMEMWTREELKSRAKMTLRQNYWRMVLVGFIMFLVTGGFSGGSNSARKKMDNRNTGNSISSDSLMPFSGNDYGSRSGQEMEDRVQNYLNSASREDIARVGLFAAVFSGLLLVFLVVTLLVRYFVLNVLVAGGQYFFNHSLAEETSLGELLHGFQNGYLHVVKTLFLRDLYTGLWTLLFIIPGIVKSYEYRMVPYLVTDHPEMTTQQIFQESKRLMDGQKWNAFVLDLSFFGWMLLSVITVGIVLIFWAFPYIWLTNAALYRKLSGADRMQSYGAGGNYAGSGYGNVYGTSGQSPYGGQGGKTPYDQSSQAGQASYGQSVPPAQGGYTGSPQQNSTEGTATPYGQEYYDDRQ